MYYSVCHQLSIFHVCFEESTHMLWKLNLLNWPSVMYLHVYVKVINKCYSFCAVLNIVEHTVFFLFNQTTKWRALQSCWPTPCWFVLFAQCFNQHSTSFPSHGLFLFCWVTGVPQLRGITLIPWKYAQVNIPARMVAL